MNPDLPVLSMLAPTDGIPVGAVVVYSFIDSDGDQSYGTYNEGDMNVLEAIGLMEHMKAGMLGVYAEMGPQ